YQVYQNSDTTPKIWSGGLNTLVAFPYDVVPTTPTMPSIDQTYKWPFVFVRFGSTAQIEDADGHLLLNPDGTVNTDPATRWPLGARLPSFGGLSNAPG